jgi:trimeric autotransporter adhesin
MLPEKFSNAQIVINDQAGKLVKQINVSSKGRGTLTLNTTSFASGVYNYSLMIDGSIIDTKQLIIAK